MTLFAALLAGPAGAAPYFFSTNDPDGRLATASRPASAAGGEIEAADDFILPSATRLTGATFTGLLPSGTSAISKVVVEIYRIFPNDSTNPPDGTVPSRVNSPSDVAFATRDNMAGGLAFATTLLSNNFAAANSVRDGINPIPNQRTGGEGAVSGAEVRFNVTFSTPFDLPADHYFFIPQVSLTDGNFFWLSAPRPITSPGGTPSTPDLQEWIRNAAIDPNWLRVGTDIVGGATPPTFNAAFSLTGATVPEPSAIALFAAAGVVLTGARLARRAHARRGVRG